MRFYKDVINGFLFAVTHGLSWLNFVSTILIVFITLTRNFDRIDDIKIYIFSAVIWVFWYLPRAISYEPKGEWLALFLALMGTTITVLLLYYSIFEGWVI